MFQLNQYDQYYLKYHSKTIVMKKKTRHTSFGNPIMPVVKGCFGHDISLFINVCMVNTVSNRL